MRCPVHVNDAPVVLQFGSSGANAALADDYVFTALDGDYELVATSEVHGTAGTDGGAVTADVVRVAAGGTIAGGTSLLSSTFNLKSTVDTPVIKNVSNGGLPAAQSSRVISRGQSVAVNLTGTLTALAGVALTIVLKPIRRRTW
jgi:hypothetical protein